MMSPCLSSAAGEDARIRLWRVPPQGLEEVLTTPETVLTGQAGLGMGLGVTNVSRGLSITPAFLQATRRRSAPCASTRWQPMC